MAAKSIANLSARAAADAVVDRVDLGAADAQGDLKIYAGTIPADADAALGGATLLATLEMSDPAFGAAVDNAPGGLATANAISDDTAADADGTATFFRVNDKDNVTVFQGDVTATSGGGDLELNTVSLVLNAKVSVTALTYEQPES